MDDRLDEGLMKGLQELSTVEVSADFSDRVMAAIHTCTCSVWNLASLGMPMAVGASFTFLTLLFSVFAYHLWLEMETAGTLTFANLLLLDAEARSAQFYNLLAAFWESLPLFSLIIVVTILALYLVPLKMLTHGAGGGRTTLRMAGRH